MVTEAAPELVSEVTGLDVALTLLATPAEDSGLP